MVHVPHVLHTCMHPYTNTIYLLRTSSVWLSVNPLTQQGHMCPFLQYFSACRQALEIQVGYHSIQQWWRKALIEQNTDFTSPFFWSSLLKFAKILPKFTIFVGWQGCLWFCSVLQRPADPHSNTSGCRPTTSTLPSILNIVLALWCDTL